ncbi:hypothetical protein LSTR_LSTR010424 [Laodelphax striatellus]|uniref:Uncharacterized protein n=1 Tax=Laodelphax striatellus TaxID=195883 RepID=A0A482XI66_LAOST|nr:hypothetical protein LSTR_LSTR010424 [Laodelphax striatellus]
MKDLTHYFNSPSPLSKKPEVSPVENENLAEEKTPKMNKKIRKKRLKLDKLTPPEAEDNKEQGEVVLDVGAEIVVKTETVNGDSSVADNEVRSDTGSERKKKKRKLSPSCEDTSKRTKRKVAKAIPVWPEIS